MAETRYVDDDLYAMIISLTEEDVGSKSLDLTSEESKAAFWKKVDRRRIGWWGATSKRFASVYAEEAESVVKAIEGSTEDMTEEAASRAIRNTQGSWEKTMTAVLYVIVKDFGEETARDLGVSPKSLKQDPIDFVQFDRNSRKWISKHGAEAIRTISQTNLEDVRRLILSGKAENFTNVQIAKSIKQFYSDRSAFKSMRIARTEVGAAAGFGQREVAKESGVVKEKMWISSRDDRVRDAHQAIDGERRGLDEPYSNGLQYPGDPSGDPAESIMCRCTEGYITKEKE